MALTTEQRERATIKLHRALDLAFRSLDTTKGRFVRSILGALRPRLAKAIDDDPELAVALLVWAWARIPEIIEGVDLRDTARVLGIAEAVERELFGSPPASAPSSVDDPDPARPS